MNAAQSGLLCALREPRAALLTRRGRRRACDIIPLPPSSVAAFSRSATLPLDFFFCRPPLPALTSVCAGVPADDPDAPDWGTIAVYCCSASCASGVTPGASPSGDSACAVSRAGVVSALCDRTLVPRTTTPSLIPLSFASPSHHPTNTTAEESSYLEEFVWVQAPV